MRWLASEPFRLFFASGVVWSVIAVSLWPLFYAGKLAYYPNAVHARLMIEAFGGAFVTGFLGTAGPRIASAPRLTLGELGAFFLLHQASAICHLRQATYAGDLLFVVLLLGLLGSLAYRLARFSDEPPPPALLLAMAGLLSGIAGALLIQTPATATDPVRLRLASLLLYQGFLLAPVLGIGSFFFPRILGGGFGEPQTPGEWRRRRIGALAAILLLGASFGVEIRGSGAAGLLLRAATFAGYLLTQVRWSKAAGDPPRGSLAMGTMAALVCGGTGLLLAGMFYPLHIYLEHLLYIGGFGLLMLMVASRVLFGHSGELAGFARRSGLVRFLVFLGLLAAVTRASTGFLPDMMISHHIYAAWTWGILALLWLGWHRRRFVTPDPD